MNDYYKELINSEYQILFDKLKSFLPKLEKNKDFSKIKKRLYKTAKICAKNSFKKMKAVASKTI